MNQIEAGKTMMCIGALNDIAEKTHDTIVKKQLGDIIVNLEAMVEEYLPKDLSTSQSISLLKQIKRIQNSNPRPIYVPPFKL